jgi:hypothetical protein
MKKVNSLNSIPAVKEYLDRIGAEPRSLLTAVVKEKRGKYFNDVAVIKFNREGDVDTLEEHFLPSETEAGKIKEAFELYEFPHQVKVSGLANLPEELNRAPKRDLFEFHDTDGQIVMLQLRRENNEGGKNYIPYTFWSDGVWRAAEPEGYLPLWGLDQLKENSVVFIHEGAKAARAMVEMVEAKTKEQKEKLAEHPWGEELKNAAHLGWVGGALSPARTDWSALKREGVTKAYIVSDNDNPGVAAVPAISYRLRFPTFHVQFTNEWPVSFDLADPFPKKMFKEIEGVSHYVGPSFRSCLHPATWATELIQNKKGKPTPVLRQHFKEMWAFIEEADLWVCTEMPEIVRSEQITNKMMSSFSHSNNTAGLLLKSYQGRATKICYRPDVDGRIVTDRSTSAINLHIPSQIKPKAGNIEPFMEFLNYVFPNENERYQVMRWCATLIARPDRKMEYGMLLVSEAQGIGKTTLGSEILAKLVGDHNVGYPSEKTIVNSDFTDWIAQKRLIVVNEIYSGHSWKAYNTLKGYITDKDVNVNAKYQRPYTIDNWAHIIAMSNSMRALRMEQDDRRWFYPEVTETRWPVKKFRNFHNWLQSGGLSIISAWANDFGDYVVRSERAPMTERKREMIRGSRTEAQEEVVALAEAAMKRAKDAIALPMKDIVVWVRVQCQSRVFDSDYELRKAMQDAGMKASKSRFYVSGRNQHLVMNAAAAALISGLPADEAKEKIREALVKPAEVMENDM